MYLYRNSILVKKCFIILLVFTCVCYNYASKQLGENKVKLIIDNEIMKKVSNMTLNSLSHIPEEKKKLVLNKIELKLNNDAQGLPDKDKYVKLIMSEFKRKIYGEKEHFEKESDSREKSKHNNVYRTSNISEINQRKLFNKETKQKIIRDIAIKIENIAKAHIKSSQTSGEKKNILEKIEAKIIESSQQKHLLLHKQHDELKVYIDLIRKGLQLAILRLFPKPQRRMLDDESPGNSSDSLEKYINEDDMQLINEYSSFFIELKNGTAIIDSHCNNTVEEICFQIKSLKTLSCRANNDKKVSIAQLCDGKSDCWNNTDEINCISQAIGKLQQGISLMLQVDKSITRKCMAPSLEHDVISHHHQVVTSMLQSQLDNLEKFESHYVNNTDTESLDNIFIRNKFSYIGRVMHSLSRVLESNLCSNYTHPVNNSQSHVKSEKILVNDEPVVRAKSEWSPKSCICKKQHCKTENCDPSCKLICWRKYSLLHWSCDALSGDKVIPLDSICDDKIDCFEASDELHCTKDLYVTKYAANNIFNDLLNIVSLKVLSVKHKYGPNKLLTQTNIIKQLQKQTTKPNLDIAAIRKLREEYFRNLADIYNDAINNAKMEELNQTYIFLHELNEKMIDALKRSHTGNKHIETPTGCYCRDGKCTLVHCSSKCNATCLIEPILTQFSCNNNISVDLKAICDGKKDCPNEEDEMNCKTEVCRSHHLIVLRNNLQKVDVSKKGSLFREELFEKWRTKVLESLKIIEEKGRPTRNIITQTIDNVLHDLVQTYSALQENRRHNENTINIFRNISEIVKQTLKSCGN